MKQNNIQSLRRSEPAELSKGDILSLPKGWEIKKLGEVIKLEYGKPLDSNKRNPNGKYPMYGANGIKGRTDEFYYDQRTIIVGRKGSAGEINLTEEKFWPLDVTYFVVFNENKYDLMFLYFLLSKLNLPKLAKGVKPGVNRTEVYELLCSFPPLPEQQRIVSILDKAFSVIEQSRNNAEQNLKNAKELFESYLQGVFDKKGEGWEKQLLENCFKMKSGDNLTANNMTKGEYSVFGGNGIAGYHNKYNLSGSNVIIGRVGALCGNVRHITEKIWLTDNAFNVVDFKFDFDHPFLTYLLNYKNLRSYARQAAQPVISNSSLKDVVLNFPKSLETQRSIVRQLDLLRAETQKLERIYQQKLINLEELKKSVLQKAFSGELKVSEL